VVEPIDTGTAPEPPPVTVADCAAVAPAATPVALRTALEFAAHDAGALEVDELAWSGDWLAVVGRGGLWLFDIGDPAEPVLVGRAEEVLGFTWVPTDVAIIDAETVAVGHTEHGLFLVDVRSPSAPVVVQQDAEPVYGMSAYGDYVIVLHADELAVYLRTGTTALTKVARSAGPMNPAEISEVVDEVVWVVDYERGVFPVDLTDPYRPVPGPATPTTGGNRLVLADGRLFVGRGPLGVEVYDVADPSAVRLAGLIDTPGMVAGLAVVDGLLHVADMNGYLGYDVSDLAAPEQLWSVPASGYVIDVVARDGAALIGAWGAIEAWSVDPSILAPIAAAEGALEADGDDTTLTVRNLGAAPLSLGAPVASPAGAATVDVTEVAPGGVATVTVAGAGEGGPLVVCMATSDAQRPMLEWSVTSGPMDGLPATDFTLPDLDGVSHSLSDQRGHPVVLAFFATWCPVCQVDIPSLEYSVVDVYGDQGVVVWAIASQSPPEVIEWVAALDVDVPVLVDVWGEVEASYAAFESGSDLPYPWTWVIDGDGNVVAVLDTIDEGLLAAAIEEALAQ
jgi:peroxiredoxin